MRSGRVFADPCGSGWWLSFAKIHTARLPVDSTVANINCIPSCLLDGPTDVGEACLQTTIIRPATIPQILLSHQLSVSDRKCDQLTDSTPCLLSSTNRSLG